MRVELWERGKLDKKKEAFQLLKVNLKHNSDTFTLWASTITNTKIVTAISTMV